MAKLGPVDTVKGPEINETFQNVLKSRGWISNVMKTLAHSPAGLHHYQRLGHYGRYETNLSDIERELAIATTVRSVPYGWRHHGGLALQAGITQSQLDSLRQGEVPSDLSQAHQALCAFVLAFSSFQGVAQQVADGLSNHYSARQVVDIAILSAYYISAGAIIIGFDVEMEPDEDFQKELRWQESHLTEVKS